MSLKDIFAKIKGKPEQAAPENEEDKPKVVNGYLQTSNTRVIRPVYSNTREGRAAQEAKAKENNSSVHND
ncbi:MAG: hypothetical protein K6C38_00925 [Saccharofermentans sp.]|nr:hypothetical protein [Saccharofermentans sp.]